MSLAINSLSWARLWSRSISTRSLHIKARYAPFGVKSETLLEKGQDFTVSNPATGESLCKVASVSEGFVKEAINDAQDAFQSGIWSKAPAIHRSKVLSKLARLLEERIAELAGIETLQTGRPIREMKTQLSRLPEWLLDPSSCLNQKSQPFNHPLLIAIKKIAPALAAGNSVVLAPITVLEFADMAGQAGIPAGVLTVLPGIGATVGKAIISHPHVRKVDVTASTETGRAVGRVAGTNIASFTAELGGKAPILVFNDADIQSAVNGVAFASFIASGQTCVSGTRIIIQDGVYDSFISALVEKTDSIRSRMGNPMNPQSTMGPIISEHHLTRIENILGRMQGKVLCGGHKLTGASPLDGLDYAHGSFLAPTIIENVRSMDELWQEEVFGPVIVVRRFNFPLVGGDFDIEARLHSSYARGGMKDSGIGRENGIEAFESCQNINTVLAICLLTLPVVS
ncbi:hypothetical protein C0993_003048 [Termitomyces sp. T159_Od127]|nr:hypothetical protein C0993_003048 [Termitomyces sp. T159_Od127]